MNDEKVKNVEKKQEKILVRAKPPFYQRRLVTIKGLTKGQFRGLRNGEVVLIDPKAFDKELYIKEE